MIPAPLLITAALDAGRTPYVALSSTQERTIAHLEGLLAWLKAPSVRAIVFAKNCGARIRPEVLSQVAASDGKELEFMQVESSPRTVFQGKGYGEGDMIRQTLEKSQTLRKASDFIKITGKLFHPQADTIFSGQGDGEFFVCTTFDSRNISPIRKRVSPLYRGERGSLVLAFLKRRVRVPWGWVAASPDAVVDTRFYRVKRDFYGHILENSYRRVQDALGYTLERAFWDDLQGHPIRRIDTPPEIIGTSGSLGTKAGEYPAEIRLEAREVAIRLLI
jgi:hypothetical protein